MRLCDHCQVKAARYWRNDRNLCRRCMLASLVQEGIILTQPPQREGHLPVIA